MPDWGCSIAHVGICLGTQGKRAFVVEQLPFYIGTFVGSIGIVISLARAYCNTVLGFYQIGVPQSVKRP